MPRAKHVCTEPGCPTLVDTGRCSTHQAATRRATDKIRGTAYQRGYGKEHQQFRRTVLNRDPICVIPGCDQRSTDADHHPRDRRTLIRLGLNPNNPDYGRGLCHSHHSSETARHQPGGWNQQ